MKYNVLHYVYRQQKRMVAENSRTVITVESCTTIDHSGKHVDDNNVNKNDNMENASY